MAFLLSQTETLKNAKKLIIGSVAIALGTADACLHIAIASRHHGHARRPQGRARSARSCRNQPRCRCAARHARAARAAMAAIVAVDASERRAHSRASCDGCVRRRDGWSSARGLREGGAARRHRSTSRGGRVDEDAARRCPGSRRTCAAARQYRDGAGPDRRHARIFHYGARLSPRLGCRLAVARHRAQAC